MISGEFVRLYSLSVGQHYEEHQKWILCAAYFGQYLRISRMIDFLDFNLQDIIDLLMSMTRRIDMKGGLRISSWNIHGLNSMKLEHSDLLSLLDEQDIIILTETMETE